MFLHRALRKSVPKEVLGKIVHARLLRVSLQQHIFEAFSMPTVTSAYVNSLVSQYGEQEQHTIAKSNTILVTP
jgi:hypothetical protein